MTLRRVSKWLGLGAVVLVAASGCGDDDDNTDGGNTAGRAGSSAGTSGSSQTGGSGSPDLGGAPSGGGTSSTGPSGNDAGAPEQNGGAPTSANGGAGGDAQTIGGAAGAGGAAAEAALLSDAQILLLVDTLNQGEVEAAYAVLPRLTSPDVKEFAQLMIDHHGEARQSVSETAEALNLAPLPSEPQRKLQVEGQSHVEILRATPPSGVDAAYLDIQVAAHAEALALLTELEEAADAAALRTLLGELRTTVQQHYEQAVSLQADL